MVELDKDKAEERGKLLINPKFQLSMIGVNVSVALSCIIIFYFNIMLFLNKVLMKGLDEEFYKDTLFMSFISDFQLFLNTILLIASLTAIIAISLFGFFFSNRIAQPIYHMTKNLKAMKDQEDLSEINLQKNDFFPELAMAFNEFIKTIPMEERKKFLKEIERNHQKLP